MFTLPQPLPSREGKIGTHKIVFCLVLASLVLPGFASGAFSCVGPVCLDPADPVPVPQNADFACFTILSFTIGRCGLAGQTTASGLILGIINLLLGITGLLAVLFVIIGGLRYITAHGNEEQAEGAKKTLLHAVIGLVVVIMSFAIINVIARAIR